MKAFGGNLTSKQEQAIIALLSEATFAAAAEKAGVSEVTIHRWLKQPEFKAAYREARRDANEKAFAQLQQSSWAASSTLIRLLASGSDSVRLRAAQAILDQSNKGIEQLDFQERLEELEQFAKEMGYTGGKQ
jgi:predicted ArsR family transcriptional regulator